MKSKWKIALFWILLPLAAGVLSGFLTREGAAYYGASIIKPPLSPPAILFPIVWIALYLLMGIGAAIVSRQEQGRDKYVALNLFVIQLVINFFWSFIFFNAQAYGFALLWLLLLLGLVILMTIAFYQINKVACLLQIPYILWLCFAAYLNYGVWQLNG